MKLVCHILLLASMLLWHSVVTEASLLSQSAKTFHVAEKSPEGTVVIGDVRQHLSLINDFARQNSLLAISNAALPGASNFKIDKFRGSLVIASPPDRDAICPTDSRGSIDLVDIGPSISGGKPGAFSSGAKRNDDFRRPCAIQLSIVFGSSSDPSFDVLTIILDDINDHAPEFKHDGADTEHVIRILEMPSGLNSMPDFGSKPQQSVRIPLPEAIDIDSPENGVRLYRLEGEDAYLFHLEIGLWQEEEMAVEVNRRHLTSSSEKRLWLVPSRTSGEGPALLDYEYRNEYRFVLVAVDGGTPPRSGRLLIRLIIDDANDHVPIFNQPQYVGVMSEDDLAGHVVLHLQASDADGKLENHRINFRIPNNESKVGNLAFSDAQVVAADLFEIELTNFFAHDGNSVRGNHRNTTSARLIVQRKPDKQLREAVKKAVEVAKKLQFSNPHAEFARFREGPSSPKSNVLRFVVEAYDFGKPSLSSQVPVIVEIVDVNDEAPLIFVNYISKPPHPERSEETCGSLLEGVGRSMIAQITVTDRDATSILTEVACNLNDSRFSLEPIPTPDNSIWSEMGTNSGSSRNGPMLMYKLMSVAPLDREAPEGPTLTVHISCTDNQGADIDSKRLTTRAKICVEIDDINDNPPQFTTPVYTFKVPENVPTITNNNRGIAANRYFIGNVHATDKDTAQKTNIEYSLSTNANGIVEIDSSNGSLFLVSHFDREKVKQFEITVTASDQGSHNAMNATGQLSSSAEVRIIITDVNDCRPEFESSNYNFDVEENVELAEVGRVIATDADSGDFGRVRYRLAAINSQLDGNSHIESSQQNTQALIMSLFQIDSRLGIIRLRGHLDREKRVHYEFVVLAMDNVPLNGDMASGRTMTRFTASATVLVMVLDQNDNPPKIQSPRNLAEFMLSSDQMIAGTTVFTIQASDADQGENATVEYSLIVPDGNGTTENESWHSPNAFPFAVDQMAGICYLKQNLPSLSSGGAKVYTFQVKAYDLGVPKSLNSTITVRIIRGAMVEGGQYTDPLHSYDLQGGVGSPKGINGALNFGGSDWWNDWGGDANGNGSITTKTMAIIVAAVFAIVVLLGILIFIYFRHQKVFNNRVLVNGVLGEAIDGKGQEGFVVGNKVFRMDNTNDAGVRKPAFTEVLPSSWVGSRSVMQSPNTFAYSVSPTLSPRILPPNQSTFCVGGSPGTINLSPPSSGQVCQGASRPANLKSPTLFAHVTRAPMVAPSAVVFRNYRIDAETYQPPNTTTKPFQFIDHRQLHGGISNNSSLKNSNTMESRDGGCLIRLNKMNSGKGGSDTNISSESSDPLQADASQSSYQRLVTSPIETPQYAVEYADGEMSLTFENTKPHSDTFKTTNYNPSPADSQRPFFATSSHNRIVAPAKPAFGSLSIDSNLDNLSSEYNQPTITMSPFTSPKRLRAVRKTGPPHIRAPEKRLNFITNANTMSAEVRGSFV